MNSPRLVIPTQLTEDQWETILNGQVAPDNINPDPTPTNGVDEVEIDLTGTGEIFRVRCTPIGIGTSPDNNPGADKLDEDSEGSNPSIIDPTGGNVLFYEQTSKGGTGSEVEASFSNLDTINETEVNRTRIA